MTDYICNWFEPIRIEMIKKFRRIIGKEAFNTEKRLDIGGFTGQNEGFEAVNILEPCNRKHDLNKFPYPYNDNSIGVVIYTGTIEHLKDPREAMDEVWRICKPNAYVLISVPYWKFHTILYNPGHYHDFKMEWFRNLEKFEFVASWYHKGRVRFWKKYHLYVVLKARSITDIDKRRKHEI